MAQPFPPDNPESLLQTMAGLLDDLPAIDVLCELIVSSKVPVDRFLPEQIFRFLSVIDWFSDDEPMSSAPRVRPVTDVDLYPSNQQDESFAGLATNAPNAKMIALIEEDHRATLASQQEIDDLKDRVAAVSGDRWPHICDSVWADALRFLQPLASHVGLSSFDVIDELFARTFGPGARLRLCKKTPAVSHAVDLLIESLGEGGADLLRKVRQKIEDVLILNSDDKSRLTLWKDIRREIQRATKSDTNGADWFWDWEISYAAIITQMQIQALEHMAEGVSTHEHIHLRGAFGPWALAVRGVRPVPAFAVGQNHFDRISNAALFSLQSEDVLGSGPIKGIPGGVGM